MTDQFFTYDAPMPDLPAMQQTYYDPSRLINMANATGPQDYSDALPFWKRSEPMRPMYEISESSNAPPPVVPVTEPMKHRRTRSGCLTCRTRRVKCDEARPICDRCRKGSRDCVYPAENQGTVKGGSRLKNAGKQEQESSSSEEHEEDSKSLETIIDEEGESNQISSKSRSSHAGKPRSTSVSRKQSVQSLQRRRGYRHPSESSSTSKDKSQSPSTDASGPFSTSATPASSLRTMPKSPADHPVDRRLDSSRWAHLKPSLQKMLQFHQEEVTFYHYFLKYDPDDFIHTTFVDIAISYEPLLYAVTGFAAYHRSLRQSNGELKDFLGHYSKSMSLLREKLSKGQKHCEASLLTILQLATFEEYLGDWIHLSGHQRAAHQMLTELYTPETIMETQTNRTLFSWYSRFDVVVGLLAGSETILDREWYAKWKQWNAEQVERHPFDYQTRYAAMVSHTRLHGTDMAVLLGKLAKGKIPMDDFLAESRQLEQNIADMKSTILSLNESEHRVTSFPNAQPIGLDEIVNPYMPGGLFREPLFFLNYAWIDWYSMRLMFTSQMSQILQRPLPPELETWALEQFRIFEAINRWPESPPGAVMGTHSSVGIASVFLPKDQKHTMWSRRKLAQLEQMGYIFPPTFRTKMAELWHDPEINRWWLPNDEGLFPLLQSIRAFAVERAKENSQPLDHKAEDLRDMKAIFSRLNIDESPRSSNSPGDGT